MAETSNKYQPLYLKYRPQSLDELVGQKSVVKTLSNALENDRIAHAYLFTGPRGTGKTSSARILAKSINCDQGPTVSPCLTCPACESIKNSSCPSVFEIDAASNNSVDDARSLIERAPLATQDGKHKLYIIDECHMLTKEAFNALLKTIEEPPPNVVFILATTEEHKVPPTIVSRCQRLMFRLVNQAQLSEHLTNVAAKEGIEISEEALDLMSRRSGGGLRDALGLLDQAALLARPGEPVQVTDLLVLLGALDEDILLEISEGVLNCDGHKVLESVNNLLLAGREPSLITVELAKHFLALTKASYIVNQDNLSDASVQFVTGSRAYVEKVVAQAKKFDRVELSQIVELIDRLEQNIKRSSQPSLTLEMGLLSICHRLDIASIKTLTDKVKKLEQIIQDGDYTPQQMSAPQKQSNSQTHSAAPERTPQKQNDPYKQESRAKAEELMQSASSRDQSPHGASEQEARPRPTKEIESDNSTPLPALEKPAPQEEPESSRPDEQSHGSFDDREPESPGTSDEDDSPPSTRIATTDLEELWSDLLDALHKKSIPAYSLVSMHANPLSLENDQLVLGVNKEFFQKSIEGKADHLQKAYKALTGKEIVVRVKVVAEGEPTAKKSEGRINSPAKPDQDPPTNPSINPSQDPPTNQSINPSQYAPKAVPPDCQAEEDPEPEELPHHRKKLTAPEADRAPGLPAQSVKSQSGEDSNGLKDCPVKTTIIGPEPKEESALIKEAYRLFEGPGSRIIG